MLTLRNQVDGSTIQADPTDTDRIDRLTHMGYRVVDPPPLAKLPVEPVSKKPARKRTTKK